MLGEKIKLYRENKNMAQCEIADILGVKSATISKYEAGTLEPNIESLKKLAELFEVSIDELIKEDDFDISKVKRGIIKSCEKRPVTMHQIDLLVANIEKKVYNSLEEEISTKKIGEYVMEGLKELDEVSYVRFASV